VGSPWCLAPALGEDTSQRDITAYQGKVGSANRGDRKVRVWLLMILPVRGRCPEEECSSVLSVNTERRERSSVAVGFLIENWEKGGCSDRPHWASSP